MKRNTAFQNQSLMRICKNKFWTAKKEVLTFWYKVHYTIKKDEFEKANLSIVSKYGHCRLGFSICAFFNDQTASLSASSSSGRSCSSFNNLAISRSLAVGSFLTISLLFCSKFVLFVSISNPALEDAPGIGILRVKHVNIIF